MVNCLAWKNKNTGFDENANTSGGVTVYNCTAYDNEYHNVDFWEPPNTDLVMNNVSVSGRVYLKGADDSFNNWNLGIEATAGDFVTLDFTANMGPRKPDGSLPDSDFLKLKAGSNLIDAGTDVGLPFNGTAPDLGAFEF